MEKSICLISYHYPPSGSVAAVRTGSIAKWLTRQGWKVRVICAAEPAMAKNNLSETNDAISITRVPVNYGVLLGGGSKFWRKRLLGRTFRKFAQVIVRSTGRELEYGWKAPLKKALAERRAGVNEILYVSGGPFCSFTPAADYALASGAPLVLEYRDMWRGHPHSPVYARRSSRKVEGRLLARSSMVVVVADGIGDYLNKTYAPDAKVRVFTNGYDEENMPAVRGIDRINEGNSIVYTGAFYPPKRAIGPFFASLRILKGRLLGCRIKWTFNYFGGSDSYVAQEAARFGIADMVKVHGRVTRLAALDAIAGAKCALVVASVLPSRGSQDDSILTGKIFEPIGLGVPTVVLAPKSSDVHKLARDCAGVSVFSGDEVEAVAQWLYVHLTTPARRYDISSKYSWRNISEGLSDELDSLLEKR